MSQYHPRINTLRPVQNAKGQWEVYDQYGLWDGPYKSASDCWAVIQGEADSQEWFAATGHY
ncbi:MAG: hypothetical protein F8N36_13685 [Desulfovibrio sp.]|uniref:hypothetical protein n=1 Tax=Desulfovibrio sp. TaxID=885 RepID=UPI00135D77BA|nr:hypothetical protein [Desulfovibrio sp.]MTJ93891.1 hypothetical protein [Desulfovibrio sp.]